MYGMPPLGKVVNICYWIRYHALCVNWLSGIHGYRCWWTWLDGVSSCGSLIYDPCWLTSSAWFSTVRWGTPPSGEYQEGSKCKYKLLGSAGFLGSAFDTWFSTFPSDSMFVKFNMSWSLPCQSDVVVVVFRSFAICLVGRFTHYTSLEGRVSFFAHFTLGL